MNGKKVGESVPVEGIASIDTVYEKGSIRAVAYENGKPCSEYTLETADKLSVINVEPEKTEMEADDRDLCYVRVSLADGAGRLIVGDDREIECHVHNGELLAFFSGDPKTEDDATSNRCHTFKGRAVAVIRTKQGGGNVTVTVCGKDLAGASRQIWAKPTEK